jgi:phenylalanyl-tRNA synthetase beta chain
MKFTVGWLQDYLDTDAGAADIADRLTALGLEVEGVHDPAADLAPFTIALVQEVRPHPDADRLRICTVETDKGILEVVCGAPNVRTGMKGVFAHAGTRILGSGDILKKSKIRGVESSGMLLSERELGISDEHDQIIELLADAPLGAPYAEVVGLADPMIEISVTPNRQDCLGVAGIARDLAAAGLGTFRAPRIAPVPGAFPSPIGVEFALGPAGDACPFFVGRTVRGVKNGSSPAWMQNRLRAIGLRPISALVDITNYMSFTFARPLHVFDADKIQGAVRVRLSEPGERINALDGKEYELDGEVTMIADHKRGLAMAGVIGGEYSGCTESTVNVFIESAVFDPVRTAGTGRRYGIESDARYRFERGIDPEFTEPGCEEATRLVLELCGGEASELVIAGEPPEWRRTIPLRATRVRDMGGLDLPAAEQSAILTTLGFEVTEDGGDFQVSPPPWRSDIDGEADLIEELLRIRGYEAIPAVSMARERAVAAPILTTLQKASRAAQRTLASRGLMEAVTWSFTSSALAARFGGGSESLRLVNPISSELDAMRPSILPNLVAAAGRNLDRGAENIGLFEVGPTYAGNTSEGQTRNAAGIRQGRTGPRHWLHDSRDVDAYDAKTDALAVLEACGVAARSLTVAAEAPSWFHPGRSGVLKQGPWKVLATFGEIHPGVLREMSVRGPVAAFEVVLDVLPQPKKKGTARPNLDAPDLLPVVRDFAFVVDEATEAADVLAAAAKADPLVANVSVFDVFTGQGVPEGKKSLAIAARLQPRKRTLTDDEIDAAAKRIVAAVEAATGGTLRT